MKVNFLNIGVQKSGSTSLINYMNSHPSIFMANGEPHFFDRNNISEKDYIQYEKKYFKTNKPIVGEKTPSYCLLRFALDNIYNYNPDMKLILILREPIQRAYSGYNMEYKQLHQKNAPIDEDIILKEIIEEEHIEIKNIVKKKKYDKYHVIRGYYDEQIEYIYEKFPKKNVYICISEEIKKNKNKEYNKIFKFLGVKSIDINENLDAEESIRSYSRPIPKKVFNYLYNIYESHNNKLFKLLGREIPEWIEYYNNMITEK